MSPWLAFALGLIVAFTIDRLLARLGKSALGKRTGLRRDARHKMLATLDHDALLTLADDVSAELRRRRM